MRKRTNEQKLAEGAKQADGTVSESIYPDTDGIPGKRQEHRYHPLTSLEVQTFLQDDVIQIPCSMEGIKGGDTG